MKINVGETGRFERVRRSILFEHAGMNDIQKLAEFDIIDLYIHTYLMIRGHVSQVGTSRRIIAARQLFARRWLPGRRGHVTQDGLDVCLQSP